MSRIDRKTFDSERHFTDEQLASRLNWVESMIAKEPDR